MKILLAEFETKHFTFRCVEQTGDIGISDESRKGIERTLRQGIRWHAAQTGADLSHLLTRIADGEYDLRILESGVLYRDNWPLAAPGANTIAEGKKGKTE